MVDKPLIQYAVEEAYAAGIREMIFVTGRTKRSIEDHFDTAYELESELEAANKHAMLDLVRSIVPDDMQCAYVRQPRALGLGHAVACARTLVGNEPFAVLLADDLMVGHPPVMEQMVKQYAQWKTSILAVQNVPLEDTNKYGIVSGIVINENLVDVNTIVEKPKTREAPSTLAVAGRYILTPGIFQEIGAQKQGVGGEIQLTDAIFSLMRREKVFGCRYCGRRYDCGSKLGFLQATVDLAMTHEDIGEDFSEWLNQHDFWSVKEA